jgi:hypothetical protein
VLQTVIIMQIMYKKREPSFVQSPRPAVIILWSADPWGSMTSTQGVRDCLGEEFNHFKVAPYLSIRRRPVSFEPYKINRARTRFLLLVCDNICVLLYFSQAVVFNKLCEIVLGRGSVAPERLRNTPLDDISSLDHSY